MNSEKKKRILKQPKIFQLPDEKENKKWSKIFVGLLLAIIAIVSLVYFIYFSNFFIIKNIEIVGSQSEGISRSLEQYKGKNLFSFNTDILEKQLEQSNNNIINLKIYRGIPDTIRVKLEDREPKIIWQTGVKKYLVDAKAVAYAEASGNEDLPLVVDKKSLSINIPVQLAASSFVEFVRSLKKEMQTEVKINNFEVDETTFQITVITDSNLKILFNTLRPLSDQVDAFNKVYGQYKGDIKEYLDLRVEGKVYYK